MKDVRRIEHGFTLIEVLVALTLMALVSLISWRGLDAVQQTGERLDERSEEALSMVRALGQIERDILLHAGADVLPGQIAGVPGAMPGGTAGAGALGRMPAGIAWEPGIGLTLVRSAGDGLWQQLRWYLSDGTLIRAVGAPSYLLPLPEAGTGVAVLEHIEKLTVRMWQPGRGWVDPPSTVRESPSADAQGESNAQANAPGQGAAALATGLEIALYRQGPASDKPYRKVVALP